MSLDVGALQQELEGLRKQRFEASQRIKTARGPPFGGPPPGDPAAWHGPAQRYGSASGPGPLSGRPGLPGPGHGADGRTGPFQRPTMAGGGFRGEAGPSGYGPPRDAPRRFSDSVPDMRAGPGDCDRGRLWDGPDLRSNSYPSRGGAGPMGGPAGLRRGSEGAGRGGVGPQWRDNDRYGHGGSGDRFGHGREERQDPGPSGAGAARKRVLSSVVVGSVAADGEGEGTGGQQRQTPDDQRHGQRGEQRDRRGEADGDEQGKLSGASQEQGRGLKRPAAAPAATDPDSSKRVRRLLGRTLLGTLQKFRQEDEQFKATEAAARRAELARKAEEKAAAASARLRQSAAEERAAKRREDLAVLMQLNLATDMKVLELLYAKKLARRRQLATFLRADGRPSGVAPVYWQPARPCAATQRVLAKQQDELQQWEASLLEELEREKEGLRARAEGRQQVMEERFAQRSAARAAGTGGASAAVSGAGGAVDDGDEGIDEDLHAGELDGAHDDEQQAEPQARPGEVAQAAGGADGDGDGDGAGVEGGAMEDLDDGRDMVAYEEELMHGAGAMEEAP